MRIGAERGSVKAVTEWQWGWRDRWLVQPGELCPGGPKYSMEPATGIRCAQLLADLSGQLDATGAVGSKSANE